MNGRASEACFTIPRGAWPRAPHRGRAAPAAWRLCAPDGGAPPAPAGFFDGLLKGEGLFGGKRAAVDKEALSSAALDSQLRKFDSFVPSPEYLRALALAAFGETRCFAAATRPSTKDKNASLRNAEELPNRGAPTSPRSWRRAFLVARKRWPEMAPRKHTGRAFCETCQTLAWFPGFGGPSFRFGDGGGGESESGGVVFTSREKNTRASCGCAPATFAPRRRLKKKTTSTESSSTRKEGLPDYSVSAAAAALPFAVTPRRAVRFLFRVARREARRRNGSESDSSSDATFSSSSGSGSSSSDDEGERRLWQRNQTKSE